MIVIVGCGVAGLSCGILLAEAGHEVEIWAEHLPPHTTSNVAAAFWYPYQAAPVDRVLGWARASRRTFGRIAEAGRPGVRMHRLLDLYREPIESPWWADGVPDHARLRPDERPPGFHDGFGFEAPVIDTRHYLPYLIDRLQRAGGRIFERRVASLDDALEASPLVFHCTGLGAKTLAADDLVYPIRGQLVHVDNPGVEQILLDEYGDDGLAYVVPRGDHCVLGGTAEPHVDDRRPRAEDTEGIIARCARLDPRLANARVRDVVVGLRPARPSIRVETEARGQGLIVHNYGHGGAGVTLSWGCAEEAVRLGLGHLHPGQQRPA
ncbi:MAG: FAD-dependent oxidoreductase [Myxococcota bacterium]